MSSDNIDDKLLYGKIPLKVMAREDLTPAAKIVWAAIDAHWLQKSTCWPSRNRLIELTGLTGRTVSGSIKVLREKGLIETQRGRYSQIYKRGPTYYEYVDEAKAQAARQEGNGTPEGKNATPQKGKNVPTEEVTEEAKEKALKVLHLPPPYTPSTFRPDRPVEFELSATPNNSTKKSKHDPWKQEMVRYWLDIAGEDATIPWNLFGRWQRDFGPELPVEIARSIASRINHPLRNPSGYLAAALNKSVKEAREQEIEQITKTEDNASLRASLNRPFWDREKETHEEFQRREWRYWKEQEKTTNQATG